MSSLVNRQVGRAYRHAARSWLWVNSLVDRVRDCGRVMIAARVGVKVTTLPGGARLAGLCQVATCGSCWVCPVCAAKIARERADEVQDIFKRWHARGGRAVLLTLTVRHSRGDSLAALWGAVTAGWGAVTSGRAWVARQAVLGTSMPGRMGVQSVRIPAVRVIETRWSPVTGWHVHVHAVLLVAESTTAVEVAALGVEAWGRWDRAVVRAGLVSGDIDAMDCRLMTADLGSGGSGVGAYFTKAAFELTRGQFKTSKASISWSPFELLGALTDAAAGVISDAVVPDEDLLRALWAEWETVSRGHRQLSISVGLRAFLGIKKESRADEVIAADDSLAGEVVALIEPIVWRYIVRSGFVIELLEWFELSNGAGFMFLGWVECRSAGAIDRPLSELLSGG